MVVPPPYPRQSPWSIGRISLGIMACLLALCVGCGLVPKETLEESRRQNQTLRADNARLKDVALDAQSRNRDLTDRAVDDARRLAVQEEALDRLERSVAAYQADRDQIERSFAAIKAQVQLSAESSVGAVTTTLPAPTLPALEAAGDPFAAFVKEHPDWSFDATTRTLSVLPTKLFERSTNRLKADANDQLKAVVSLLKSEGSTLVLEFRSPTGQSQVQTAKYEPESNVAAKARFLAASRASLIRQRIVEGSGISPHQARLMPLGDPEASSTEQDRRFSIRIVSPTLDSNPRPAR